jgi:hypothetical protein
MEHNCVYFVRHPVHEELYLGVGGWTALERALLFITRESAGRAAVVPEAFVLESSIDIVSQPSLLQTSLAPLRSS